MPKKDKSIASSSTVAESENIPENRSQVDVEEESISTDTPGVIVIHPGSHTLRLGFSTQLDPHSIPHVIAYRTTKTPPTHCPSICVLKHPSPITVNNGNVSVIELIALGKDDEGERQQNTGYH
jgi:actin-related protein